MSHRQCSSLRVSLLFVANGCIYSPFHLCDRKSVETAREKEEFALANNSSPSWQERCLVYFPDAVLNHCPKVMGGGQQADFSLYVQVTIHHWGKASGTRGRNLGQKPCRDTHTPSLCQLAIQPRVTFLGTVLSTYINHQDNPTHHQTMGPGNSSIGVSLFPVTLVS